MGFVAFLKKIVVGEDEDAIAHLVQAALGDAGFLVLRARDGAEALRLVQRESPDLLILDVMMPHQDGHETVQKLKADPILSGVPVLMLTALGSVEDRVKGLGLGADDYLPKPFDLRELLARVRSLTRLVRRERDRSASTNLPGPGSLEEWVDARLRLRHPFHLFTVELEGFDERVAKEGWLWATTLLGRLGTSTAQLARAHHAMVSHLGGDDFVFAVEEGQSGPLSAETVASELRLAFDQAVEEALHENGNGHGHGHGPSRAKPRTENKLHASVATVSCKGDETLVEVSQRLARTMGRALRAPTSFRS